MKFIVALLIFFSFNHNINAQKIALQTNQISRPKIVIGIVVDQMRWDYLYRYYNRYSTGGFKKLLHQGYSFENTFIPFVPTYTAVGHTTIYTGGVPATHGMVGNNWFDKTIKDRKSVV